MLTVAQLDNYRRVGQALRPPLKQSFWHQNVVQRPLVYSGKMINPENWRFLLMKYIKQKHFLDKF